MFRSDFITDLAKILQPKRYVELGVGYAGFATLNQVHGVLPVESQVYGVDVVDLSAKVVNAPNMHFHHCSTDEFYEYWDKDVFEQIDMIFIDALHTEEAVFNDAKNFYRFLTEDTGIMLLHDTWPIDETWTTPDKSGTAHKAVKRLKDSLYASEVLTIPSPHGLTLIRKVGNDWRNGLN